MKKFLISLLLLITYISNAQQVRTISERLIFKDIPNFNINNITNAQLRTLQIDKNGNVVGIPFPVMPTPDLQSVNTIGNTSTLPILFNSSTEGFTWLKGIVNNYTYETSGNGGSLSFKIKNNTTNTYQGIINISNSGISFSNANSRQFSLASPVNGSGFCYLPRTVSLTRTLLTSINGVYGDEYGNVDLSTNTVLWNLTGNSLAGSATGTSNFLGTTNSTPLILRSNNNLVAFLDGNSGNNKSTNLFLGKLAGSGLYSATSGWGTYNIGIGNMTLNANITSPYNTVIGSDALKLLSTGSGFNTVVGYSSLPAATSAGFNTILGSSCGIELIGGSSNIMIGYNAGRVNTNGSNNIHIGNNTYNQAATNAGNVFIGNGISSQGDISNTIIVGDGIGNVRFKVDNTGSTTFNGTLKATQFKLTALNTAPTSSSDTGTVGDIKVDNTYIYICVATNTWKRSILLTW